MHVTLYRKFQVIDPPVEHGYVTDSGLSIQCVRFQTRIYVTIRDFIRRLGEFQ